MWKHVQLSSRRWNFKRHRIFPFYLHISVFPVRASRTTAWDGEILMMWFREEVPSRARESGERTVQGRKRSEDGVSAPDWLLPDLPENPGAQVTPKVRSHLKARRWSFVSHVNQAFTSGCPSSLPPRIRKEDTVPWSRRSLHWGRSLEKGLVWALRSHPPHGLVTGDCQPGEGDLGRAPTVCTTAFVVQPMFITWYIKWSIWRTIKELEIQNTRRHLVRKCLPSGRQAECGLQSSTDNFRALAQPLRHGRSIHVQPKCPLL